MTKQQVFEVMKQDHARWKEEWRKRGAPGDFYYWLLENVEKNLVHAGHEKDPRGKDGR